MAPGAVFLDRARERSDISTILRSRKFEFLIVYGRRRVGKTALVMECIKSLRHVYFLAEKIENMPRFIDACATVAPGILNIKEDFHAIFDFMKDKTDVIVLDEFQNLVAEHPNVPATLQSMIDGPLKATSLKLVIVGSSISMMNSLVLSSPSPLYGRRTAALKLGPVPFFDLHAFFPRLSFHQLLDIHAFCGGIPYYLNLIDPEMGFWTWLDEELRKSTCFIDHELDFLMRYEFTRPEMYMRVLDAIAKGSTKMSEIASKLHVKSTDITPYLRTLLDTDFVTREAPVTDRKGARNSQYRVQDAFVAFWYRCILPHKSALEQRILRASTLKPLFQSYLGAIFEDVVRQYMLRFQPSPFTMIGRWWWKDHEIDLVAFDEHSGTLTCIECEWSDNVHPAALLKPLMEKMGHVPLQRKRERMMIFSRSFKTRIGEWEGREVTCIDAADMDGAMKKDAGTDRPGLAKDA